MSTKSVHAGPHESEVLDYATGAFRGIIFSGGKLVGTNVTFKNFEIVYGTDKGDYISGATDFKNIYLGNGNNVIDNLSGGVLPG